MRLSGEKIRVFVGYCCACTGVCFLLLAVGFATSEAIFLARSSEAQGTIVANVGTQIGETPHDQSCPQFQFRSEGGQLQTLTSSACSSPPTFRKGESIRVRYLRSHPENGQIDSFGAKWGLVLGFGIACAVLLPIGFLLLSGLRSQGVSLDPMSLWD